MRTSRVNKKLLFIPIASPVHDRKAVEFVLEKYLGDIRPYVDEVCSLVTRAEDLPRGYGGYVVLVLTGGSEHVILELAREDKPMLLVPHDKMNSLPATIEAYSRLFREGRRAWIASLETPAGDVAPFTKAVKAYYRIRGSRIGVVGGVSPWLVYSRVDRRLVKKKLGMELVDIPLSEVVDYMKRVSGDRVREVVDKVTEKASEIRVPRNTITEASKVYLALKEIVDKYRLDGLTIKCFDLVLQHGVTACLALALLNSEGIVAGCEGDIPAAIAMYISYLLTGCTGFLANVSWILGDEVQLAHCTIALNMVEKYVLDTHFETNQSVGIEGYLKGGKVSLLRLSPEIDKLRVIVGDLVTGEPFSKMLCRTQVVVKINNSYKIIEDPMGNHYILVPGDIRREVKYLSQLLGIEPEIL